MKPRSERLALTIWGCQRSKVSLLRKRSRVLKHQLSGSLTPDLKVRLVQELAFYDAKIEQVSLSLLGAQRSLFKS